MSTHTPFLDNLHNMQRTMETAKQPGPYKVYIQTRLYDRLNNELKSLDMDSRCRTAKFDKFGYPTHVFDMRLVVLQNANPVVPQIDIDIDKESLTHV